MRVIFKTGKMNVKEDRVLTQMRSFQLRNIVAVVVDTLGEEPPEADEE